MRRNHALRKWTMGASAGAFPRALDGPILRGPFPVWSRGPGALKGN